MVFFIRYIDACALFQHFDNLIILKYRMIFICYHNTRYIIKVSLFYIGISSVIFFLGTARSV